MRKKGKNYNMLLEKLSKIFPELMIRNWDLSCNHFLLQCPWQQWDREGQSVCLREKEALLYLWANNSFTVSPAFFSSLVLPISSFVCLWGIEPSITPLPFFTLYSSPLSGHHQSLHCLLHCHYLKAPSPSSLSLPLT